MQGGYHEAEHSKAAKSFGGKPRDLVPIAARSAVDAIKLIQTEKSVKCTNAKLHPEDIKMFADTLRQGAPCVELFLGANEIGDDGTHYLTEAMKSRVKLKKLDLGANMLTEVGAHDLAECLKVNFTQLTSLNLSYNSVGDTGAFALGESLKNQSISKHACPLVDLDLQMNDIDDAGDGIENLADALKQMPSSIVRLNLGGNMLGENGGKCLGDALLTNTTLHSLDLSGTMQQPNIEASGVKYIAEGLRMPSALRQLAAGDMGIDHFCLTYLNLAYNRIDDAAGQVLATELRTNTTIKQLVLKGNCIGEEAGRTFASMLCGNKSIKLLDMSSNSLTPMVGLTIAEMLKVNKGIRHFNLSSNRLGSRYASEPAMKGQPGQRFAEGIGSCRSLEFIDLGGCGFDAAEERAIRKAASNENEEAVVLEALENGSRFRPISKVEVNLE